MLCKRLTTLTIQGLIFRGWLAIKNLVAVPIYTSKALEILYYFCRLLMVIAQSVASFVFGFICGIVGSSLGRLASVARFAGFGSLVNFCNTVSAMVAGVFSEGLGAGPRTGHAPAVAEGFPDMLTMTTTTTTDDRLNATAAVANPMKNPFDVTSIVNFLSGDARAVVRFATRMRERE